MFYIWMLVMLVMANPLLAGLVILAVWLLADRAWFAGPKSWRWWKQRARVTKHRARLEVNPHDRDARFGMAEHLASTGRHDEALALIQQNIDAGDDDDETLLVAGIAAWGSSTPNGAELAEQYLAAAREKGSSFRAAAVELELGRGRLRRQQFQAAEEALRAAIDRRPGSIESHVLLAHALAGQGKTDEAQQIKKKAWQLYKESPRFQRRQDRSWAWRANPTAALRYIAVVVAVVVAVAVVVPRCVADDVGVRDRVPYQRYE